MFAGFAASALPQLDGAKFAGDLRAKYGPPLAREVFVVLPGVEMVVDYAANGNVCRIQLPPTGPDRRQPGVTTPQAIDDFLAELLPPAMRGKELRRTMMAFGAPLRVDGRIRKCHDCEVVSGSGPDRRDGNIRKGRMPRSARPVAPEDPGHRAGRLALGACPRRTAETSASISRMVNLSVPRRLEAAQVSFSHAGASARSCLAVTISMKIQQFNSSTVHLPY